MKITKKHFKSINELVRYTNEKSFNEAFKNKDKHSETHGYSFTKTYNYDEAEQLLKNGWSEMAKDIEKKLKVNMKNMNNKRTKKTFHDVVGHQVSVPRYLMGIPTNMVNQKTVMKKQKVITVNKDISYNAGVDKDKIIEQSVKALQIIKEIEASGMRVNLNLVFAVNNSTSNPDHKIYITIRLKNANERLNVSKLAFPLVHPSMLRRIMFKVMEKLEGLSDSRFCNGYGYPKDAIDDKVKAKKEVYLPKFIDDVKQTAGEIQEMRTN